MLRRGFLKKSGIAIPSVFAGSLFGAIHTITGFQDVPAGEKGETIVAHPGPGSPTVPPDTWRRHSFSFATNPGEGRHALTEMLDATEMTFTVDGYEVRDQAQYWTPITKEADGQYHARWEFVLPPAARGEHTFAVTLAFPHAVRNLDKDGTPKTWSGIKQVRRTYTVTDAAQEGAA